MVLFRILLAAGALLLVWVATDFMIRARDERPSAGMSAPPPAPASAPAVDDPITPAPHDPLNVQITVLAAHHLIVSGETNLPDGTVLNISVEKPYLPDAQSRLSQGLPACGNDCFPYEATSTVKGGKFSMTPFSGHESEIMSVPYNFTISTPMVQFEPLDIQRVLGRHGEYLTGSNVLTQSMPGEDEKMVQYTNKLAITPDGDVLPIPYGCAPSVGLTNGCKSF
jgi:hypothetical protein